ncbi:MMPL family transporter, partial [Tsukamurella soli]
MFAAIGRFTYRFRFTLIAVLVVVVAVSGVWGYFSLGKATKMSGLYDEGSQSVAVANLTDSANGRTSASDILVLIQADKGKSVTDPAIVDEVKADTAKIAAQYGAKGKTPKLDDAKFISYATVGASLTKTEADGTSWGFLSLSMLSNDDTQRGKDWDDIRDGLASDLQSKDFTAHFAGLVPVTSAVTEGVARDSARASLIALPLVAIVLFFVFGGVIAAALPVIIGVMSIGASSAIVYALTFVTDVNFFVGPIIELIGLGIAIDYGLFIVSRFREELAEGYDTPTAVRRTVMTAGRTVIMSSMLIIGALLCLYIAPLGLLTSMATGALLGVLMSALLSLTMLPAMLAVLGPRVDSLSLGWFLGLLARRGIGGERVKGWAHSATKTKTKEEVERGLWGRVTDAVMKRPAVAAGIVIVLMLALVTPITKLAFGGISQEYLPPTNTTRQAQDKFQELFPTLTGQPIQIVFMNATDDQINGVIDEANKIPGFTGKFVASGNATSTVNSSVDPKTPPLLYKGHPVTIQMYQATLQDPNDSKAVGEAVTWLRGLQVPGAKPGYRYFIVGGTPVLQYDSIESMLDVLPWLMLMLVVVTTVLMFLAFGSLILPIKAVLMSALTLASTLGFLTWMFVEGHGGSVFNFTGGPLMAPVLVLIIAVVFGLSTDYEVFLISRMIEERATGATTPVCIRAGTANTGRIITAAALILIVVTAAFATSELVMMKYVAFGLIAALILDATVVRMVLVPAVMKMLGDDCWWAPHWMRRIQHRIGLGEIALPPETKDGRPIDSIRPQSRVPGRAAPQLVGAGVGAVGG